MCLAYKLGQPPTGNIHCMHFKKFNTPLPISQTSRSDYNHDSTIYTFGTPFGQSLQLPTCACILASPETKDDDGKDIVRPYTPLPVTVAGEFQLLVKRYPGGKCSGYMHSMKVGDTLRFKHIKFNVKIQYPFNKKSITMITGGTGYISSHTVVGLLKLNKKYQPPSQKKTNNTSTLLSNVC